MASSTKTQVDEVAKLVAIVEHLMRARDNDARLDKPIDQTIKIEANLVEETVQIY